MLRPSGSTDLGQEILEGAAPQGHGRVIADDLGNVFEVHLIVVASRTEVQVQDIRKWLVPFLVREPLHQSGEGMVAEHGHSILVRLQEKRWRSGVRLLHLFKTEALRAQCIVAALPIKRGCPEALAQHWSSVQAAVVRSSSLSGCRSRTIWWRREVSRWV